MHHICYNYTDTTKNRLSDITATGLNSGTYQYDALGNLVRDNAEGLTIGWNALGKVDTIRRNDVLISSFRYSPTGQRQVKTDSSGTTYYIHDATGNVMCVYRLKNDTLTASERYIYGSKRLGMLGQQVWITAGGAARLQDRNTIGHRLYELTDHLGNVTTTLPDRKYITPNADNELIYIPDAVTYTDYYPFGYPIPERSFYMGGYRYFFNGQEADNEVFGEGALAGYEFRQYDTRLGRWWGIDRKTAKYPSLSPYQFCAGNPVWCKDVDGSDFVVTVEKSGSENIITVKMNVYAISETAYKQLLPAVAEINSITRTVTIDDVQYTLYFEINPFPPSETNDITKSRYIAEGKALSDGYLGNVFLGTNHKAGTQEVVRDGHTGYVGGRTSGKSSWMYPGPDGIDFGNYYKIVGHELLHLLGLDDKGGKFYTPGGRMEYIDSFDMYDISNDDIRNILRYAFLFNQAKHAKENVRVDYLDDIDPIAPNPNIEVK